MRTSTRSPLVHVLSCCLIAMISLHAQPELDATVYSQPISAVAKLSSAVAGTPHSPQSLPPTSLHSSIAIEDKAAIRQKLLSALDEPVNHVRTATCTRAHTYSPSCGW